MKTSTQCFALAIIAFIPLTATAQDDEGPLGFSYVTYYICDVATQGNMDNVVENNEYAVFDKWVEEGKLMSWGYLSHFTGGRWRRAQYHVSATMEEALQNQANIFREIYSDNREGGQADRGDVSLSVYFVCSVADQSRADEIFAQTYAPKLNEMQEEGKIGSWGWQSHALGGEFRRLQTVTGADHASVTAARFETLQHVNQNHPGLAREFSQICDSHIDYLWDIVHESP
jgi:hypothetical protein